MINNKKYEWDREKKGLTLPARAKGTHTPARPRLNRDKKSYSIFNIKIIK